MSKSLIIDAGHGGQDSGAKGFGKLEKDLNLLISLYQYERLKELGANVSITRKSDVTIVSEKRTALIKNKYDYCLSNHFNAFDGRARGVEAIHSIHTDDKLARKLTDAVVKVSGLPFRRVFTRKLANGRDYYFMHRETGNTNTIILEYGFIDNVDDFNYYENIKNLTDVAEAVIEAWCQILGITYRPKKTQSKKKFYKVQVGHFGVKENADQLAEKLKADGYDAYIYVVEE